MLYERVKKIAYSKGLRLNALENEAGISNGAISKWKSSSPTIDTIRKVAKVLNVNVSDLLFEDGEDANEE